MQGKEIKSAIMVNIKIYSEYIITSTTLSLRFAIKDVPIHFWKVREVKLSNTLPKVELRENK
jgi:hypothetical protein